ncbi:hypothetical protein [Cupriavidus campinensis]|uniref:hypothetical protein n=1 Tax=Cupriavidus campinensis TaxID=151783 RepID=UPI0011EE45D9|nr:hypothetical protein [Cupriavidus campinensis]
MPKQQAELGVVERVEAVLALQRHENLPLSIAAVCRLAQVNRASLYVHHPAVVERIKGLSPTRNRQPVRSAKAVASAELHKRLQAQLQRNRALLLICLELECENQRLRARLAAGQALKSKNAR